MLSFTKFPKECQYDDTVIENMTIQELSATFHKVKNILCGDELQKWQVCMWSAIMRIRSNPNRISIEKVVRDLELQKRTITNNYYRSHSIHSAIRHNEIEYDIRWLCRQYEIKRTTKQYLLGPKNNYEVQ